MVVLLVHNYYQQPGGEDVVFAAEADLLAGHGHRVHRYTVHNDALKGVNPLILAKKTIWSSSAYWALRTLIHEKQPHVVHVHNTLPQISPAVYYAARAEGTAVVQTLHNYRLLCPSGLFFRSGRACEDCLNNVVAWPGIAHACYRGSRAATGAVATMVAAHRALGTWENVVDRYIALTEFARQKFIQGGLPAEKIAVKPNFVHPDPGTGRGDGGYALFVGRLSPEKGIRTLLTAWAKLHTRLPLKIAGDGPLAAEVRAAAQRWPGIMWLGHQPAEDVRRLMADALMLVLPSEWYETFGLVAAEAFAAGTPVVVSKLGAIAELVEHGRTGLHFRPGDPEDLQAQVAWALTHPAQMAQMRMNARAEYEAKYAAARNYEMLMNIYEQAIERAATQVT